MKKIYTTLFLFLLLMQGITKAQTNNALAFDGNDDVIKTAGASSLIAASNNISMTCWVYPQNPTPNGTYDGFCGFRNNIDADFYILHFNTTTVEARLRNSSGIAYDIIGTGIQINTWQHLAFTYDGSMLRYYRNGVMLSSISATGNIANTTDTFYMGGVPFGADMFELIGKLDEVSLWNKTLTQSEISCIYNSGVDSTDIGLQLLYKFNQGTAGGNNTSITTITDAAAHLDATTYNFAMTGTVSNFVTSTSTVNSSTASICPGTDYIWGNDTLTQPGVYTQVLTSSLGCDSTVQLTLTPAVDTAVTRSGFMVFAHQTGIGVTYQWLNCNTGFSPIAGATFQSYTPTVIGSYAVKVTYNGCTDTSSCYVFTSVGIKENSHLVSLIISPNPATDLCTISAPSITNATLYLYDVVGKMLEKQFFNNQIELSLTGLNAGVYLAEIRNESGIIAREKLVKQ